MAKELGPKIAITTVAAMGTGAVISLAVAVATESSAAFVWLGIFGFAEVFAFIGGCLYMTWKD